MEFYETIKNRRTIRDFEDREVPKDVLERILDAGLKAPSGDHLRDMHYVVLRDKGKIAEVVKMVGGGADMQMQFIQGAAGMNELQKNMYLDALPKQRRMLVESGTLILPLYMHGGDFDKSDGVSSYSNFASTWCGIENMMLAATAEGLACAIRIPIGNEPGYVTKLIGSPSGYVLCCYLAVGYPAQNAAHNKQLPATISDKVHYNHW